MSNDQQDEDRGFLNGIDISDFMNVYQEWHAFIEGFCEVICPWSARYAPSEELLNDLRGDHHYYVFGRALGVIAWLVIADIIKVVFF